MLLLGQRLIKISAPPLINNECFRQKVRLKFFSFFFYGEGTFYSLAKKSPPPLLNNELFLRHFFYKMYHKKKRSPWVVKTEICQN